MKAFAKSVGIGSLAGGAPFMLFTVPSALMVSSEIQDGQSLVGRVLSAAFIAVSPALLALMFVFPAGVILGLPLTAILKSKSLESKANYVLAGAAAGFLIPLAFLLWIDALGGFWLAFLGAFSGAVTANIWAQERGLDGDYCDY